MLVEPVLVHRVTHDHLELPWPRAQLSFVDVRDAHARRRRCGAAIIHVDAERKLIDADGNEHIVLNENVLIEIGAAMALYGRRFILLVREGVKLPSNLQGLYEVRYEGDGLDAAVAMRLLEAIADIKNHPLSGAVAA